MTPPPSLPSSPHSITSSLRDQRRRSSIESLTHKWQEHHALMGTTVTVLHSTQPHHHHHHHHPRPFCTSSFPHTRTPGGRVSTAMTLGTSAVCSCITRTSGIGIGRLRVRILAGAAGIFLFQSLTFSSRVKLSVLFLILCPFYTV